MLSLMTMLAMAVAVSTTSTESHMIYIMINREPQELKGARDSIFKQEWYKSETDYYFNSEQEALLQYEEYSNFCDVRLNMPGWEECPKVIRAFDFLMQYDQQVYGWEE